jgi:hypothetical protein
MPVSVIHPSDAGARYSPFSIARSGRNTAETCLKLAVPAIRSCHTNNAGPETV